MLFQTISFTYGADGLRGTKTVKIGNKTETSEYVYANGQLAYEKRGDSELYFFYDGLGHLAAIRYYEDAASDTYTQCYVATNMAGDVLNLIDGNGNIIAKYAYDAWGNVISVKDGNSNNITDQTHIALVNPILYRGYYYDKETKFYYLQSRYYDPAIGRFLNIDDPVVLKESPMVLTDKNLYAYCDNNPVTRTDDDGEFWETAFDVVSLSLSIVDVAKKPSDPLAWVGLVGDAVDLIPFVTGVGEIVRAIKITKKATEGLDTLHDVGNGIEIACEATEEVIQQGWKVGDDIRNLTKAGNTPSWSTVRQRYWKNEAYYNGSLYDDFNFERIKKGLAPIGSDGFSMELHHPFGRNGDNFFIFEPLTQTQHRWIHYG